MYTVQSLTANPQTTNTTTSAPVVQAANSGGTVLDKILNPTVNLAFDTPSIVKAGVAIFLAFTAALGIYAFFIRKTK